MGDTGEVALHLDPALDREQVEVGRERERHGDGDLVRQGVTAYGLEGHGDIERMKQGEAGLDRTIISAWIAFWPASTLLDSLT